MPHGVHERKIAHRPREEGSLGVARPAKKKGRGREVDDAPGAERFRDRLKTGHPDPRRFPVPLGLLLLVAGEGAFVVLRSFAVAVMRLVVQDQDVFHAHQFGHHPPEHLPVGFQRPNLVPAAPFQQCAPDPGKLQSVAPHEGMIVGDDDPGAPDVGKHVDRRQFAAPVIAVGIVRLQDPEPVADREAGSDDEKTAGVRPAARPADRVDRLPGDDHRHHRRLAGAGRKLEGEPRKPGIAVRRFEVIQERLPAPTGPGRDFGQPDQRFDRLDLAEERANAAKTVVAPVPQEAGRLRRDVPVPRIRKRPPSIHLAAKLVDDRYRFCVSVETPVESPKPSSVWLAARFCGFGTGVTNSARRLPSRSLFVGCPSASSSQ